MKSHFAFDECVRSVLWWCVCGEFFFDLNFNSKLCCMKYSVERKSEQSAEKN